MREIALDTETTGFDPKAGHRMVEIGCVEMMGRIPTGNHYHVYLNPERDMPKEAEKVHGLSSAFLKDKPKFVEVADDFLEFIGDSVLVIHNAQFDMNFINHELAAVGRSMIPMERAIDTVDMARKKYPGAPANLDALCRRYEIDLSERTLHGALLDAELLAAVYLELTGGRQAKMTLEEQYNSANAGAKKDVMAARDFPIAEDELKAHKAFIAKEIKDAMWGAE